MSSLCEALESLAGERRRVVILRGAGRPSVPAWTCTKRPGPISPSRLPGGSPARSRPLRPARWSPSRPSTERPTGRRRHHGLLRLRHRRPKGCESAFPRSAAGCCRPWLWPCCARGCATATSANHAAGEPIDAPRALQMGIVRQVVPADRLLVEARAMAATVLKGGPEAVRRTKRLLGELDATDIASLLDRALDLSQTGGLSDEAREGLAAFREHREPNWTGRNR